MDTEQQPPDLSLELPRDTYRQIVHTLRGRLPPPDTDTPQAPGSTPWEALAQRDRAAIARVAAILPGNADEADIAAGASPTATMGCIACGRPVGASMTSRAS